MWEELNDLQIVSNTMYRRSSNVTVTTTYSGDEESGILMPSGVSPVRYRLCSPPRSTLKPPMLSLGPQSNTTYVRDISLIPQSKYFFSNRRRFRCDEDGKKKYGADTITFFTLIVLIAIKIAWKCHDLHSNFEYANLKIMESSKTIEEYELVTMRLKKEKEELVVAVEEIMRKVTEDGKKSDGRSKVRQDAINVSQKLLQKRIQRESHREMLERFGPGPHRVEFNIILVPGEIHSFIIQLAPLHIMPHSVHIFLEQVHHKLWDNCVFAINAPHILQAGPYLKDGRKDITRLRKFEHHELDTISFQEYAPEFPHAKYTIGLSGRPGGPDFYVNKQDNSMHHGPGGQERHILAEEADPCFAFVVSGFDVIDKIYLRETRSDLLVEPVVIQSARLIGDEYEDRERKIYEELKKKYVTKDTDIRVTTREINDMNAVEIKEKSSK